MTFAGEATDDIVDPGVLVPDFEMDGDVFVYTGTFLTFLFTGFAIRALPPFTLFGDIDVARSAFFEVSITVLFIS